MSYRAVTVNPGRRTRGLASGAMFTCCLLVPLAWYRAGLGLPHPRVPGIVVADITSLPVFYILDTSLWKTSLILTLANEIVNEECGKPPIDIILGDFSHTLLVLYATFRIRMGRYIGIPTSRVPVYKFGNMCALFPRLTQ